MPFLLKLKNSIHTLDGKLILPAGTLISPDTLRELANSSRDLSWKEIPFLEFDTVRDDLKKHISRGPYQVIFSDPASFHDIQRLMDTVLLPSPALEALRYFRRNDYYTYRHILMVFALSCLLARDMKEQFGAYSMEPMAGPLHDFGKISVPLEILTKASPLKRSEKESLKEHAVAGFVLLTYYLKDPERLSARVARDHHEKRDGSGYPRGIYLDDPMIEIVTACDIYDALISPRPYRERPFDNRTALEQITEAADQGKISWDIVRLLVSYNRKDKPPPEKCDVSLEKRGHPPEKNFYGTIIEDDQPPPDRDAS